MGLFESDSEEDRKKRVAEIEMLTGDINQAIETQERAMAEVEAGKQSAVEWVARNTPEIIATHQLLMNALAAGDETKFAQVLKARKDTAGLALAIPMDGPEGKPITLRELVTDLFGIFSEAHRTAKQIKTELPAAAFANKSFEAFVVSRPREKIEVGEASLWSKMMGHHREEQFKKIQALDSAKKLLAFSHSRELTEAGAERTRAVGEAVKTMEAAALHHFRLREAVAGGNAAAIRSALDDIEGQGLTSAILALPFYDASDEICPVSALALESLKDGSEKAEVYDTFVRLGVEPQPAKVIAHSFAAENRMASGPLQAVMADMHRKDPEEFEKTVLDHDGNGASLIERAMEDDGLQQALLSPLAESITRAGLMLKAADRASSPENADILRGKAEALAGGKIWLKLSPQEALRMNGIARAGIREKDNSFEYASRGFRRISNTFNAAAAAVDYLSRQPDFVRLSDREVFNLKHTVMAEMKAGGDNSVLEYCVRGEKHAVACAEETAEGALTRLQAAPGWMRAGNKAFNAALIDNMWVVADSRKNGNAVKIHLLSMGDQHEASFSQEEAEELLSGIHARGGFVQFGSGRETELVNTATAGAFWFEPDAKQTGMGSIFFTTGLTRGKIGLPVSVTQAPKIFDKIAAIDGYTRTGPVAAVKTELADALWHRSNKNSLHLSLAGKQLETVMKASDASALISGMARVGARGRNPAFIQDEPGSILRVEKMSFASHDTAAGKFSFDLSGHGGSTAIADREQAESLLASLKTRGGFISRKDGTIMNPDAIDIIWQDKSGFNWVAAGTKWLSGTVDDAEGKELIGRIVDPRPVPLEKEPEPFIRPPVSGGPSPA